MNILIALDSVFPPQIPIRRRKKKSWLNHCFARWINKQCSTFLFITFLNWHYKMYAFWENAVGKFRNRGVFKMWHTIVAHNCLNRHILNNVEGFVYDCNFPFGSLSLPHIIINPSSHLSASTPASLRLFAPHKIHLIKIYWNCVFDCKINYNANLLTKL